MWRVFAWVLTPRGSQEKKGHGTALQTASWLKQAAHDLDCNFLLQRSAKASRFSPCLSPAPRPSLWRMRTMRSKVLRCAGRISKPCALAEMKEREEM